MSNSTTAAATAAAAAAIKDSNTASSIYTNVEDLGLGFKYSPEFSIIICSTCTAALPSKASLPYHLKTKHLSLEPADTSRLLDLAKDLRVIEAKNTALPLFYRYNFKDLDRKEVGYVC